MQDAPEGLDDKTEWAELRTDWAEDRTGMANERTFAGWMRTALAAVAVGLGLNAVFRDLEPTWVAKAVSSIFIAAAIFILWAAQRAASGTRERINRHAVTPQTTGRLTVMAVVLTVASLATGAILWML